MDCIPSSRVHWRTRIDFRQGQRAKTVLYPPLLRRICRIFGRPARFCFISRKLTIINGEPRCSVMPYTDDELNYIYDKTNGCCWHCGKKLAWRNYGMFGEKGAWEVDHSNPLSRGGTDYLRNLVPSCIECNRSKGDLKSKEF